MPSLPLPPGRIDFGALAAAQQSPDTPIYQGFTPTPGKLAYSVPDPLSRPREDILVSQIYLPVAIACQPPAAQPNPQNVNLQLTLADGIRIFWAEGIDLPLTPGTFCTANTIIAANLQNPVRIGHGDLPTLRTVVSFDQATSNSSVYIAAQLSGLPANAAPTGSQSTVYYEFA